MNDSNKVVETFNKFRQKGWMPGSTGSLALLCGITENSNKIYVTPDKVQDKIAVNDLFLLRSLYGSHDMQDPINKLDNNLQLSRWSPLFIEIIATHPETRALAQVTTKWGILAARMALDAWKTRAESHPNVLRLSHWELLKDINGGKELLIPIVNLSEPGKLLTEVKSQLSLYPNTCAIIIRDYGMVVWGNSFSDVERRIEILEHVCEMQIYSYTLLFSPSLV